MLVFPEVAMGCFGSLQRQQDVSPEHKFEYIVSWLHNPLTVLTHC